MSWWSCCSLIAENSSAHRQPRSTINKRDPQRGGKILHWRSLLLVGCPLQCSLLDTHACDLDAHLQAAVTHVGTLHTLHDWLRGAASSREMWIHGVDVAEVRCEPNMEELCVIVVPHDTGGVPNLMQSEV